MTNDFTTEWDEKFDKSCTKDSYKPTIAQIKLFMHSRDLALEAEVKQRVQTIKSFVFTSQNGFEESPCWKDKENPKSIHEYNEPSDGRSECIHCGKEKWDTIVPIEVGDERYVRLSDVLALLNS